MKSQFSPQCFSSTLVWMDKRGDQLDFEFPEDDLLEFPRDLGEEGWFQFHAEQKQLTLELEKMFGVIFNQRVRLRLAGRDEELEGTLVLASLLPPSDSSTPLRLRMGRIYFTHTDIELCQPLD